MAGRPRCRETVSLHCGRHRTGMARGPVEVTSALHGPRGGVPACSAPAGAGAGRLAAPATRPGPRSAPHAPGAPAPALFCSSDSPSSYWLRDLRWRFCSGVAPVAPQAAFSGYSALSSSVTLPERPGQPKARSPWWRGVLAPARDSPGGSEGHPFPFRHLPRHVVARSQSRWVVHAKDDHERGSPGLSLRLRGAGRPSFVSPPLPTRPATRDFYFSLH